jgi:hypothetical protein
MAKFEAYVTMGLVGCKRTEEFEVDDIELEECETKEGREKLISDYAREIVFNMIEWDWKEAE